MDCEYNNGFTPSEITSHKITDYRYMYKLRSHHNIGQDFNTYITCLINVFFDHLLIILQVIRSKLS